jgi:TonB family protein
VVGICEYYDQHGELAQKFDYTNRRLVYNKPAFTSTSSINSVKSDSIQDAAYIGGDWAILSQLKRLVHYPPHAIRDNIHGKVVISFVVNEEGKAVDQKITQSVDPELDQEALRAVKLLPNEWVPAYLNDSAVSEIFNIPVVFKLE